MERAADSHPLHYNIIVERGNRVEEKKDRLAELMAQTAPLARAFLDDPEMMKKLKAASPWLSEEYLVEMLKKTAEAGKRE